MKDSFILIANMEKVPFNIQMVPSIMENGWIEKNKVMESS
jgi:hypothetical protein